MQLSKLFKQNFSLSYGKTKKDKIKRAVIFQPLAEGGLNFTNFDTMVKSLRLAWLSRLLGDKDDSRESDPELLFIRIRRPPVSSQM